MLEDTKQDLKYVGYVMLFIISFFSVMYYLNSKNYLGKISPIILFLLSNVVIYIILFVIFKNLASEKNIFRTAMSSLAMIIFYIGVDLIVPPYSVNFAGQLLEGSLLGQGSSDYFLGYIYNHLFGISGLFLFISVYILSFLGLMVLSYFLIGNFVKKI